MYSLLATLNHNPHLLFILLTLCNSFTSRPQPIYTPDMHVFVLLERIHTGTARTCKFHTGRLQPASAYQCASHLSVLISSNLKFAYIFLYYFHFHIIISLLYLKITFPNFSLFLSFQFIMTCYISTYKKNSYVCSLGSYINLLVENTNISHYVL